MSLFAPPVTKSARAQWPTATFPPADNHQYKTTIYAQGTIGDIFFYDLIFSETTEYEIPGRWSAWGRVD